MSSLSTQHYRPKPGAKIVVGISGGVDSAMAAALLMDAGFQVEGLFMKNWEEDDGTEYCSAIADLEAAQGVCDHLGLHLRTANFAAEYWDNVFDEFLSEYAKGRTPNPDVLCNREIKFKQFVDYAAVLDAEYIATGHYARLIYDSQGRAVALAKGADSAKDQSYFLQAVPLPDLARCVFPLGELTKSQIRDMAKARGLTNHDRKDSTGICFIGERRLDDFLGRYIAHQQGPILDESGRSVGEHSGVQNFTLGQRQGLNIGGVKGRAEAPWYVLAKHSQSNTLYVTQQETLLNGRWLQADQVNWLQDVALPLDCHAKIRYRQSDQACRVSQAANGRLLVAFEEPQRAIAPGQFVAFYADDILLGGGKIQACDQWTPTNLLSDTSTTLCAGTN